MTEYEQINEYRERLIQLKKKGEIQNEALYWSGKMATYLNSVLNTPLTYGSQYIPILTLILNEYNEAIYNMTMEQKNKGI